MEKTKGGRPHLDGSPAGSGEYTVTKCITIAPSMVEYLRAVGGGNLSKGIRVVAKYHRATSGYVNATGYTD